jgi:hypothetical protein
VLSDGADLQSALLSERTAGSVDVCEDRGMAPLPEPDDLTSLVIRVDFSDDAAWDTLQANLDGLDEYSHATYVNDPTFANVTVDALVERDAGAADDDKVYYLFLADATTMTDDEHPLLAVDLDREPGRTFRVPPRWFIDVSANLSLANMDFDEFADAADADGTFRGFGNE